MKLLTKELQEKLPPLGSQDDKAWHEIVIYAKFFTPDSSWTWYVAEGSSDGSDFIFFGFVVGPFPEWGDFALSELEGVRGALGLPVERDRFFATGKAADVIA